MDVCLVVNTLANLIELGSVSIAKKGNLEYVRGAAKVVNLRNPEESARECYGVTQQLEYDLGLR